jgi:hypothetical protein
MALQDWTPFTPGRPWLPGPPPQRRRLPIQRVLAARSDAQSLDVPVTQISLDAALTAPALRRYKGQKFGASSTRIHLFHGSAPVGRETLDSFARLGPCRDFSRPIGYLSRGRAVYWTTSLEFALAWCNFIITGAWDGPLDPNLSCLVYVAEVDLTELFADGGRAILLPRPCTPADEDALTAWCDRNMRKTGDSARRPPPGCQKADWGVIASRIPQHTVASLDKADGALTRVFGRELNAAQIHLVAACDDEYARQIASGGVEILYVNLRQEK